MARSPQVYLVSYDVRWPDPADERAGQRRLGKVYRLLRGFGDPIQKSVFRCTLSDLQRAHLEERLDLIIHKQLDQVLFVHLGAAGARTSWRTHTLGVPLLDPERSCKIIG
jgi:CRISPR-associated protein Cas2